MSLFKCLNPNCNKPFATSYSMWQHMNEKEDCTKYTTGTILYESSDNDTDSENNCISEENDGDITDAQDNFNIGINTYDNNDDDDDDDDNNDDDDDDDDDINSINTKRQKIDELPNGNEMLDDGSFPITKEKLIEMMTPEHDLPSRMHFQLSLLCLLSQPSIPLYIYSEVIRLINEMINQNKTKNSLQFDTPFPTSRKSILKNIEKIAPGTPINVLPYYPTKSSKDKTSVVVFDAFRTIQEEVQNPTLWFQENLAMNSETKWGKNVPISSDDNGMIDLSESISGTAYSDAYDKYIVGPQRNDYLLVPFGAWIDETGLSPNLRHPCQPFLINCLLAKRDCQRNRLLAYVPSNMESSAEKTSRLKNSEDSPLQKYHSAMRAIFQAFDDAARKFKEKKITVTLGGTVKEVFIIPVLLYMKGDHKSHQTNTCRSGMINNSICIMCNRAPAWEADNEKEVIGEKIDAKIIRQQNEEYSTIVEEIDALKESIASNEERHEIIEQKEDLKNKNEIKQSLEENFGKHSITPCINSFEEFSHLATSIYHCSPPDHLHVFLLGILKYAAEATIGIWTDTTKNNLEKLANKIVDKNSSSVRNKFPRYPMRRGLTNLSLVSGTEWLGFWFIILVVGRTNEGSDFLSSAFEDHYEKVKLIAKENIAVLSLSIASTQTPDGPKCQLEKSKLEYNKKVYNRPNTDLSSILLLIEELLIFHSAVFQKHIWKYY